MPYNVTNWKTKKLENLKVPIDAFYQHPRTDWHPKRINHDDGTVELRMGEMTWVKGDLGEDGTLSVKEISAQYEFSGTSLDWVIEPALNSSTGHLVAARVWEGGDYIDKLTATNGEVVAEEIEL